MFENIDKLIDINLRILGNFDGNLFLISNFNGIDGKALPIQKQRRLSVIMQEKDLLDIDYSNDRVVEITQKGYTIHKSGGWLEFLKVNKLLEQEEELLRQRQEVKEQIETQKLIDDAKVSRLNSKYRYVPYILSILSFIIACLAYFRPLDNDGNKELSKDEIIHIIDSVSTSNQEKKDDSLLYKEFQTDSLIN